jgi:DHA1 family tetracycline resistance protein-like MFS transporter
MPSEREQISPTPAHGGATTRAFLFVLLVVLLDVVSLGVTLPVLPRLVVSLGQKGKEATSYGVFVASWQVAHLLAAPVLGALSDRFGRRPLILLSCAGLGLDYFLMATASSTSLLLVGRIISGVTAATFSIAAAYVADTTPVADRPQRFAQLGAVFSVGFVLGPALGGALGRIDLRLPFWVAGAVTVATALVGGLVLPESLDASKRTPLNWRKMNPVGALRGLLATRRLAMLSSVAFLYFASQYVFQSAYAIYVGVRYTWGELQTGLALAGSALAGALLQSLAARAIARRLGERRMLQLALASGIISFVIVGSATTGLGSLASVPFGATFGLARAGLLSGMSSEVGAGEQGRLQGALVCLGGIAGALFPTVFTWGLGWGARAGLPGASFYFAGAVACLALVVSALVPPKGG